MRKQAPPSLGTTGIPEEVEMENPLSPTDESPGAIAMEASEQLSVPQQQFFGPGGDAQAWKHPESAAGPGAEATLTEHVLRFVHFTP